MKTWTKVLLSIPKTLYVNFRYLPLQQALKLPFLVAYNVDFQAYRGGVILPKQLRLGMIRIGFFEVSVCNHSQTAFKVKGTVEFRGTAYLGRSSKVLVMKGGRLVLGEDFKISSASSIFCINHIEFGSHIMFSWDCLVMDSDTHVIMDSEGKRINDDKPIVFGNNIWIGCRCTILKGSIIPDGCVIGASSTLTGQKLSPNTIVAGNPPSSRKVIGGWHL